MGCSCVCVYMPCEKQGFKLNWSWIVVHTGRSDGSGPSSVCKGQVETGGGTLQPPATTGPSRPAAAAATRQPSGGPPTSSACASTVLSQYRRVTTTGRVWPMRCTRATACCSTAGSEATSADGGSGMLVADFCNMSLIACAAPPGGRKPEATSVDEGGEEGLRTARGSRTPWSLWSLHTTGSYRSCT